MGKKEKKIDENKVNTPKINNIIYSKNSIQFRNDNIVNLISLNGKSWDKNTEILIKNRNKKPKLSFTENIIEIINIDNKKLFMLYIDTSVSCKLIKESLIQLSNQLKELLITKNVETDAYGSGWGCLIQKNDLIFFFVMLESDVSSAWSADVFRLDVYWIKIQNYKLRITFGKNNDI